MSATRPSILAFTRHSRGIGRLNSHSQKGRFEPVTETGSGRAQKASLVKSVFCALKGARVPGGRETGAVPHTDTFSESWPVVDPLQLNSVRGNELQISIGAWPKGKGVTTYKVRRRNMASTSGSAKTSPC